MTPCASCTLIGLVYPRLYGDVCNNSLGSAPPKLARHSRAPERVRAAATIIVSTSSSDDQTQFDRASGGASYGVSYSSPHIFPLAPIDETQAVRDARVLLFSQRNVASPVWHGYMYEFEDVIKSLDNVQVLAPSRKAGSGAVRLGQRLQANIRGTLGFRPLPDAEPIKVDGEFDLFFAVFHFAWQAHYLRQIRGWRQRCRKAVCFIIEQWLPEIEKQSLDFKLLAEFDQVFVFSRWSIPTMRTVSGARVDYLPIGTDSLASCPHPVFPPRTIDVLSVGRRVPWVHEVFWRLMEQERLNYIFDAARFSPDMPINHVEHRALFRHLLKRSQYFLAFRHNDSPEFLVRTGGEEAIPVRYFESIAGGPLILGTVPTCADYLANFDWPDAAIPLPVNAAEIEELLGELQKQPDRLTRARACNIINALRRHDWAYRWQQILDAVGLSSAPGVTERISRLNHVADAVGERLSFDDPSAFAQT